MKFYFILPDRQRRCFQHLDVHHMHNKVACDRGGVTPPWYLRYAHPGNGLLSSSRATLGLYVRSV